MKTVERIPKPVEYQPDLTVTPKPPKSQEPARLCFVVYDPWVQFQRYGVVNTAHFDIQVKAQEPLTKTSESLQIIST
jgi:hypothetical protein